MDTISNILSTLNQECNFSEKIKENVFSETKNLNQFNPKKQDEYNNFVFCILDMTMPTISIKTNCNEK